MEERHRAEKKALSDMVQSLNEKLANATVAAPAGAGGEDTARLRSESQALREENASLRDEVRDVRSQLEDQRRAAKRKVAELENLLRHVTEELSRQGDAGKLRTDHYQLQEDNARLEEELNRAEAKHEQAVAEYEQRLQVAEATAPSSDELVRMKKEKAAIEIVMNQLGEELEEEKHLREVAEKKAAQAGQHDALVDNSAMMAAQSQMAALGGGPDTARTQEALFQELDRAKAEIRNQRTHMDDLDRDLVRARHDKDMADDDRERETRAAEAEAKKKQLEYTGHLTELQMELAHVCNVLSVMDQNCKVLEVTQVDTDVLHLAKREIDEKDGKIKVLEEEKQRMAADRDVLEAQFKIETEKREAYEKHIIDEKKKQQEQAAHLSRAMQNIRTVSHAAPQMQQQQQPMMGTMPYGAGGSTVAASQSWAQGAPQNMGAGYSQVMEAPPPHDPRAPYVPQVGQPHHGAHPHLDRRCCCPCPCPC
jgi:hypothetical protein